MSGLECTMVYVEDVTPAIPPANKAYRTLLIITGVCVWGGGG